VKYMSLIAVIMKLFAVVNLTTFRKDILSPTSGIGAFFFLRIGDERERTGLNLHKYSARAPYFEVVNFTRHFTTSFIFLF
jgi:hypothetical protein